MSEEDKTAAATPVEENEENEETSDTPKVEEHESTATFEPVVRLDE